jgi:methylphosphotriester-DNA--protein-cysteine methyltransferase
MTNVARLDVDTAWAAFMRRDRSWDGQVIGAVSTTGIYCKPSCPAKRPKRENVQFLRPRRRLERPGIARASDASPMKWAGTVKRLPRP